MASKLDWTNTDASNMPDYASDAFDALCAAMEVFEKAWTDHAPVGRRPVFAYRKSTRGDLTVGVALANGSAKRETFTEWQERNKFRS